MFTQTDKFYLSLSENGRGTKGSFHCSFLDKNLNVIFLDEHAM